MTNVEIGVRQRDVGGELSPIVLHLDIHMLLPPE
jgi:hypothetical protein